MCGEKQVPLYVTTGPCAFRTVLACNQDLQVWTSSVRNGCCSYGGVDAPRRGARARARANARAHARRARANACAPCTGRLAVTAKGAVPPGAALLHAHIRGYARRHTQPNVVARTCMHAAGTQQPHAKQSQLTHRGLSRCTCRSRSRRPLAGKSIQSMNGRGRWLRLRLIQCSPARSCRA